MGLRPKRAQNHAPQVHEKDPDYNTLISLLAEGKPAQRRRAVLHLVEYPTSVLSLLVALKNEQTLVVRQALFDTLQSIGGSAVVNGLIPLLSSEDANMRNGAIEVLQTMPQGISTHILALLNDPDSDVRIFAIDILLQLAHPDTPQWLLSVLKEDTHINVIATAVDRLAEVGTPDMIADLLSIKMRFPNQPYIDFAVDTAISRIQED